MPVRPTHHVLCLIILSYLLNVFINKLSYGINLDCSAHVIIAKERLICMPTTVNRSTLA
jgi:hypothetical protein